MYPPEGHPISVEKAKALVDGPLGEVYTNIALSCAAPVLWFRRSDHPIRILHNGTVTVVKTAKKLFGVTAAHVLDQYNEDAATAETMLQLKGQVVHDIRVIDSSSTRDLATIELDQRLIENLDITPLAWPPERPMEGRGLLVAGFPGRFRTETECMDVEWAPFFAITTARTVTDDQITILIPRDGLTRNSLPPNCDLGGISGGPIIGIFETKTYLALTKFSGVITEHPNYVASDFSIERIVGCRADVLTELGNIR